MIKCLRPISIQGAESAVKSAMIPFVKNHLVDKHNFSSFKADWLCIMATFFFPSSSSFIFSFFTCLTSFVAARVKFDSGVKWKTRITRHGDYGRKMACGRLASSLLGMERGRTIKFSSAFKSDCELNAYEFCFLR